MTGIFVVFGVALAISAFYIWAVQRLLQVNKSQARLIDAQAAVIGDLAIIADMRKDIIQALEDQITALLRTWSAP